MAEQNRIIKIECNRNADGTSWTVKVMKEFEDRYGGGEQTFVEQAPYMHMALDVAREMITLSPGQRTDLSKPGTYSGTGRLMVWS